MYHIPKQNIFLVHNLKLQPTASSTIKKLAVEGFEPPTQRI